jgi:hypothetical protein
MTDEILLYCSILGPDGGHAFPVRISRSRTVGDLKDAIKKKKGNALNHIDADQLEIWKVSDRAPLTPTTYA